MSMYILSGGYSYVRVISYLCVRGDRSRDLGIRCILVSGGMAGVENFFY